MKKYLNKKYLKIITPVFIIIIISLVILLTNTKKETSKNNKKDSILPDTNIIFNSNQVGYDNSNNTVSKNDVQDAIDELYEAVTTKCYIGYTKGNVTSSSYTCTKKTKSSVSTVFDSINVSYDNSNGISSNNVEGAINDLISEIGYCDTSYIKQNETSSGYNCIDRCSSVTYQDGTTCSVECTTETGTYNRIAYSSYDNEACPAQNQSSGGSSCNGETVCASWRYSTSYYIASTCQRNCSSRCRNAYRTSVWSCVSSLTVAPSEPSLAAGMYCWCKY